MGAKASKPAQAAGMTRKFPSRAPGSAIPPTSRPPPAAARPQQPRRSEAARASFTKDEAIRADALDPSMNNSSSSDFSDAEFNRRLHQMGVASPQPTLSTSSVAGSGYVVSPSPSPSSTSSTAGSSSTSASAAPPFSPQQKHQQSSPASPAPASPSAATATATSSAATLNSAMAAAAASAAGPSPTQPLFTGARRQNPTLTALEARRRLAERAEAQFEDAALGGRGGGPRGGREFLDVGTIRQALVLRERGVAVGDIERRLRLKEGVMGRLGGKGVLVPIG